MSEKCFVMAIKPKYAKAIYEGRKNWEFRKIPPPLFRNIYIYETAPVSAVTGTVCFSGAITGVAPFVFRAAANNRAYRSNGTGITMQELDDYAGANLVTALRVLEAIRIEPPVKFAGRPPQNWGRYEIVSEATQEGNAEALNEA